MANDVRVQTDARDQTGGGVTPKAVLLAFLEGLTKPTTIATLGAFAITAALFASCVAFVTPGLLARINIGYLMQDRYDAYANLTAKVFRLQRDGVPPGSIILMETSAFHHAFVPTPELEQMIEERVGRPVHIVVLNAAALSLLEQIAIIDRLGSIPDAIVVIPMSDVAFTRDRDYMERMAQNPRLGFRSQAANEELRHWGVKPKRQTGNYFLDNSGFFTSRLTSVKNLVTGPKKMGMMYDEKAPLPDESRWERLTTTLKGSLAEYPQNGGACIEMLGRFIDLAKARGARQIVLLEAPRNPRAIRDLGPETAAMFERDIDRFAAQRGLEHWNVQPEAQVDEADFVDWVHMRKSGSRTRYSEAFANRLAGLLKELDGGQP